MFTISGLWHGANWTFIIWGAINGFYLVFAIVTEKNRKKFNKLIGLDQNSNLNHGIQIVITFVLANFAWIFFRANNTQDALVILKKIAHLNGSIFIDINTMLYSISGILFLIYIEFRRDHDNHSGLPFKTNHWLREQIAYTFLIIGILTIGVFDGGQFIYFQF